MKTRLLIGLFCGAALFTQAAQFGFTDISSFDNISVYGVLITPTTQATVGDLQQDPWWGNSDLARTFAIGYAQVLFDWAKYQQTGIIDHLPDVYFAFNAEGANFVDTWVLDEQTGRLYQEDGNNIHMLLGMDPPHASSVPDAASTAGLMTLALGGVAALKRKAVV